MSRLGLSTAKCANLSPAASSRGSLSRDPGQRAPKKRLIRLKYWKTI
jgi:hypothetical protein